MDFLASLSKETWHTHAANVGWANIIMGLWAIVQPKPCGRFFYGREVSNAGNISLLVPLLGFRDITIGTGIVLMARNGLWEAVGYGIIACALHCLADTTVTWRHKGATW